MMYGRQTTTDSGRAAEMAKVRVYELAKEIGLPTQDLVDKVRRLGVEIRNHMSAIDGEVAQQLRRSVQQERVAGSQVTRISATVMRRRSKVVAPTVAEPEMAAETPAAGSAMQAAREEARAAEMTQPPPPVPQPPAASESVARVEAPITGDASDDAATEAAALPRGPASSKREIRFAPGFKPPAPGTFGGHGPRITPPRGEAAVGGAGEPELMSAAEAARLIAPAHLGRPKVIITDLDQSGRRTLRKNIFGAGARTPLQRRGRKKVITTKAKGKKTEITMPAEHKRVIRFEESIGVGEIARQMGVKSTEVLKKLWAMGMTGIRINQTLDADAAGVLAAEFGYDVANVAFREETILDQVADSDEDLEPRSPIITVMGHVDHGKTSLLDAIRNSDVAGGEAGGITQHIGAYRVATAKGDLVFLDTPGHEAFTEMRARGAHCTDIVILVVAADDGVMPTTLEALDHARDAKVPIVVAVNKIDLPQANPDRVRTELAERNLVPDDWGGDTQFVPVSARTREGLDRLVEAVAIQAELLELKANPNKPAKGTIVEGRMDRARGAMATVLVLEGTLRVGDLVVTGEHLGKVRAILDDRGRQIREAGPSTPVEVLGLDGVPEPGDALNAVTDDKAARQVVDHRRSQARRKSVGAVAKTVEEILGEIQSGQAKELKLLVKADVHGSAEAIREAIGKLTTDKVQANVISTGVGGIHETDVNLAKAAGAVIIGFNVRPAGKASQLAEHEGVEIRIYDVIYELLDDAKELMRGLLPKDRREKPLGRLEVRQTFNVSRVGNIAGSFVTDGRVTRNALLRLIRENVKVYEGKVSSLRRFKDDVREVQQGYECGVSIEGYRDIQVGDIIEAYEIEEVVPSLE